MPTGIENLTLVSGAMDALDAANPRAQARGAAGGAAQTLDADYLVLDLGRAPRCTPSTSFSSPTTGSWCSCPSPPRWKTPTGSSRPRCSGGCSRPPSRSGWRHLAETALGSQGSAMRTPAEVVRPVAESNPDAAAQLERSLRDFRVKLVVESGPLPGGPERGACGGGGLEEVLGLDMDYLGAIRLRRPGMADGPEAPAAARRAAGSAAASNRSRRGRGAGRARPAEVVRAMTVTRSRRSTTSSRSIRPRRSTSFGRRGPRSRDFGPDSLAVYALVDEEQLGSSGEARRGRLGAARSRGAGPATTGPSAAIGRRRSGPRTTTRRRRRSRRSSRVRMPSSRGSTQTTKRTSPRSPRRPRRPTRARRRPPGSTRSRWTFPRRRAPSDVEWRKGATRGRGCSAAAPRGGSEGARRAARPRPGARTSAPGSRGRRAGAATGAAARAGRGADRGRRGAGALGAAALARSAAQASSPAARGRGGGPGARSGAAGRSAAEQRRPRAPSGACDAAPREQEPAGHRGRRRVQRRAAAAGRESRGLSSQQVAERTRITRATWRTWRRTATTASRHGVSARHPDEPGPRARAGSRAGVPRATSSPRPKQ